MKDFTLDKYQVYLEAIQAYLPFYRFDTFMDGQADFSKFCILRHDVDRKPQNALNMAKLEQDMGIVSTYYFRIKKETFKPDIIKVIADMGHEVGYHYECLSDTRGDVAKALVLFEQELAKFREVATVKTISMHGRPLLPHDNRDIWKTDNNYDLLANKYNLLGEVYLGIDYTDIAYINDTGRNWTSSESNRRDQVDSNVIADFESSDELLQALQAQKYNKIIFQIHPERWSNNSVDYYNQLIKDGIINQIKAVIK